MSFFPTPPTFTSAVINDHINDADAIFENVLPFACHFYVRGERCFNVCSQGGRRTSDIRQHIQHRHLQPLHCTTCGLVFSESGTVTATDRERWEIHVNARLCSPAAFDPYPGASAEQWYALREQTWHTLRLSEDERWYCIWDILFPGVPRPASTRVQPENPAVHGDGEWKDPGVSYVTSNKGLPSSPNSLATTNSIAPTGIFLRPNSPGLTESRMERLSQRPDPEGQGSGHTREHLKESTIGNCNIPLSETEQVESSLHDACSSPSLRLPQSDSESNSSDEEQGVLSTKEQREALLSRLMNYFFSILSFCPSQAANTHGAFRTHTGSEDTVPTVPSQINTESTSDRRSDPGSNNCRKRPSNDDHDNEDGADSKRTRTQSGSTYSSKRLACPYFKKHPDRYHTWRSCTGPGWETVHRVKEHLYRNHALPISCPRCHEPFGTEAERDSHARSLERCEIRDRPDEADGFNTTQRDLLKSRRRGYKQMSEPQKWREVYLVLFADTSPEDVPSPYYEFGTASVPTPPGDPLSEYENFLRQELPDRVRQQLEVRIENALYPVEEALRSQIVDIVRDMQLELFRSYMSSHAQVSSSNSEQQPQAGEPHEETVTSAQDQTIIQTSGQPLTYPEHLAAQLQAYRPEPYFEEFHGFDGLLFDFGQFQGQQTHADSAYESMPGLLVEDEKHNSLS